MNDFEQPTTGALVKYDDQKELATNQHYDFYLDYNSFEEAQRRAQALSTSGLIPDRYKGERNVGNVLMALNIAKRLNADILAVFQNVYSVHGQIGLSGKFIHALLNNSGRFSPIDFEFRYDAQKRVTACTCIATDLRVNKVRSMTLTWEEVVAAGWNKNKGSMVSPWNIYRQMMFVYRVVAHFAKTYAPEIILGMQSVEELRDMERRNGKPRTTTIVRKRTTVEATHEPIIETPIHDKPHLKMPPPETVEMEADIPEAIHEFEPPPIYDESIPYSDDPSFSPAGPIEDHEQTFPEEGEPQSECWWDDMRHWQYRKPVEFYLIVMIGFGIAFRYHTAKTVEALEDLEMGKEQKEIYFTLTKKNPEAICSIPEATLEIQQRLQRKFTVNSGFLESTWVDFENS